MPQKGESAKYISLSKAAEFCSYSQEYLSLRARQGKLKAVKFGRNWVTTKEWLEEYINQVKEYNNNLKNKKVRQAKKQAEIIEPKQVLKKSVNKNKEEFRFSENAAAKRICLSKELRFGFAAALVCVLLFAGFAFGKEPLKKVFGKVDNWVAVFSRKVDHGIIKSFSRAGDFFADAGEDIIELFSETRDIAADAGAEISNNFFAGVPMLVLFLVRRRKIWQ